MILINATIKYKGYSPLNLSKGSHDRICCSCDKCGRVRWLPFKSYRDLCMSCSRTDRKVSDDHKDNISKGNMGKKLSNDHKAKISKTETGKIISDEHRKKLSIANSGKNNPMYGVHRYGESSGMYGKKHTEKSKIKMSCTRQGIEVEDFNNFISGNRDHVLPFSQCLKINKYFKGSHRHHISSDVIIYISRDLHYHIDHNLKDGKGMNEMNLLSLQFIKGEL